jgi:adenylate cyclase
MALVKRALLADCLKLATRIKLKMEDGRKEMLKVTAQVLGLFFNGHNFRIREISRGIGKLNRISTVMKKNWQKRKRNVRKNGVQGTK